MHCGKLPHWEGCGTVSVRYVAVSVRHVGGKD